MHIVTDRAASVVRASMKAHMRGARIAGSEVTSGITLRPSCPWYRVFPEIARASFYY